MEASDVPGDDVEIYPELSIDFIGLRCFVCVVFGCAVCVVV